MFVNSEQTLITILRQKNLFFRLMDYAQSITANHTLEFTISDYEQLLAQTAKLENETEQRRLFETLSVENLERNGLLSYIDRHSGRFRLQDFVLEMLRHLDKTRLRELSSAELNQLMRQLEESYRQISNPMIIWDDQQDAFVELVSSVYDTLQHVASQLSTNVRALQGQAERLANLVDEDNFTDLSQTHQIRVALEAILKIHERHVTPTLQFLDPRLDIKRATTDLFGESAPMAIVQKIITRFTEHRLSEHVTRLQRIQWHILSMGREVSHIAKSLDSYVRYAAIERKRYNRIEKLYTDLIEATQAKHTGNLRDYLLKNTDPVFQTIAVLGGIKNFARGQNANLNWPTASGTTALDEVLRVRLTQKNTLKSARKKQLPLPLSQAEIAKRQHIGVLTQAMQDYSPTLPIADIYLSLHHYLSNTLCDYSPHDLPEALAFIKPKFMDHDIVLAIPFDWGTIHYGNWCFTYRVRCLSLAPKDTALHQSGAT